MGSLEGRAALSRFHEARQNGTLPAASKTSETYELGQIASFNIISDSAFVRAEFELVASGTKWRAWHRTDGPDGQDAIRQSSLETMRVALDERTPEGSIDPGRGIVENNQSIFGDFPVYPAGSDGTIDMLIYRLDPGQAGFFLPVDLDPRAADSVGNQGEFLYLDTDNFNFSGNGSMESVVAHELQHMILANYDSRETNFVNEGLSEYAQQMNGYGVTWPFYLFGPAPEHNISFFRWEGLYSADYERASLWTGYVAERVGPEPVGMITRSDRVGLEGYQDALVKAGISTSISTLLTDFHTANFLDDRSIDPAFGYLSEQRASELGHLQLLRLDGSKRSGFATESWTVSQGGVEYLTVENIKDLDVKVDVFAPDDFLETRRQQMIVRVIATDLDGKTTISDFNPSADSKSFSGSFETVRFIFAHTRPESTPLKLKIDIDWEVDPDRQVDVIRYVSRSPYLSPDGFGPVSLDSEGRDAQATMFVPPVGSVLDRVTMAVHYRNMFAGGPAINAPRDFTFTIWASDGTGWPGEVIYSEVVEDPVPWFPATDVYSWTDFELDPPLGKSSEALPDTIFIGLQNAGSDDNYLIVWPSAFNPPPARETGFVRVPIEGQLYWIPLWDLAFSSDPETPIYNLMALPVQARFIIDNRPVAIEESTEIPDAVSLEQNYPNPFNPSTQIRFALPESDDVRLEVFDVTGRRLSTLLEGRQNAGSYSVTVDASSWSSGMYFYRLTTGGEQMVKRMVVLK